MEGKFIVFEGIDGAGKTTQITYLKHWLQKRDIAAYFTYEPGDNELGKILKPHIFNTDYTIPTTAFLMLADRFQHLQHSILPQLKQNKWVISDRYHCSTLAYQATFYQEVWFQELLYNIPLRQPDIVFWLDIPPTAAKERINNRKTVNFFDKKKQEFFQKVHNTYLQLYKNNRYNNIVQIDASQKKEMIAQDIVEQIQHKFNLTS